MDRCKGGHLDRSKCLLEVVHWVPSQSPLVLDLTFRKDLVRLCGRGCHLIPVCRLLSKDGQLLIPRIKAVCDRHHLFTLSARSTTRNVHCNPQQACLLCPAGVLLTSDRCSPPQLSRA